MTYTRGGSAHLGAHFGVRVAGAPTGTAAYAGADHTSLRFISQCFRASSSGKTQECGAEHVPSTSGQAQNAEAMDELPLTFSEELLRGTQHVSSCVRAVPPPPLPLPLPEKSPTSATVAADFALSPALALHKEDFLEELLGAIDEGMPQLLQHPIAATVSASPASGLTRHAAAYVRHRPVGAPAPTASLLGAAAQDCIIGGHAVTELVGSRAPQTWRQGVPAPDLDVLDLEGLKFYFNYPLRKACELLQCGETKLKRHCRALGVPRWPYRKLRSLSNLIDALDGDGSDKAHDAVNQLLSQKHGMQDNPTTAMPTRTKRLRQAHYKAVCKAKRKKADASRGADAEPPGSSRLEAMEQAGETAPGDAQ